MITMWYTFRVHSGDIRYHDIRDKERFLDEEYEMLNKSFKTADDYKPDVNIY